MVEIVRERIAKVEQLPDFEDEYVYDITMEDGSLPYFFANDILVHNSAYFLTGATTIEEAIEIADFVAQTTNSTFQAFMQEAFFCQPGFDNLIEANREVVALRGLFQARKKYMLRIVDLEGRRVDKFKATGSEIKKSDTPKVIQKFLQNVVDKILDGDEYSTVESFVNAERKRLFSKELDTEDLMTIGKVLSANNLDLFTEAYKAELKGKPMIKPNGKGKLTVPGQCRAAINHNVISEERYGPDGYKISSGDKVRVFSLKKNPYDFRTIAFAAEAEEFPEWFPENFQIDLKESEEKLIDNKLKGIFESWGYDVPTPFGTRVASILQF